MILEPMVNRIVNHPNGDSSPLQALIYKFNLQCSFFGIINHKHNATTMKNYDLRLNLNNIQNRKEIDYIG